MVETETRAAVLSDADAIAAVHSAAWREAFTFLPPAFLRALTPDAVLDKWQRELLDPGSSMFVATNGGRVVGLLQLRCTPPSGEVMSLYVEPSLWRSGVGSTLLALGEVWLAQRCVDAAMLWTAKASDQSRRFYEAHEWVASGKEQTQLLVPGVELHEVEYRKALT